MKKSRQIMLLLGLIICVALPAAGSLTLYFVTGNPLLRPLGITQEKLSDVDASPENASIMVEVGWGRDYAGRMTQSDVRRFVVNAFKTNTDDFFFRFRDVEGQAIGISFVVGANRYGPYPPGRIINGMIPSLVALKMVSQTGN